MKKAFFILSIFVLSLCQPTGSFSGETVDEALSRQQEFDKYASDTQAEIDCELKNLEELKKNFAEEESKNPDIAEINKTIIGAKEKKISVMSEMVSAFKNADKQKISELEEQKAGLEYEFNIASLKKDMSITINDLKTRASQYPTETNQSPKIAGNIQQASNSYANIIKTEKDIFKLNQKLKQLYKDKDYALKQCEILFLELEKDKKIKELSN